MPNLFNHNLIKTHIQNHQIDSFDEKFKVIQGWKKSIQTNKGINEKSLQAAFLQGIFGRSLGYKTFGEADEWHLSIEVSTEVDATTPDGILGFYTADESITQVVIELKSPRISLDKKQNRAGKDYGTPVDQAFGYASKYDRCSWVIVSNMNEIRLYKVGRSQEYYESFFVDDLDNIDEFKKFHLLLCKENLIRKEGQSPTFSLSEKTKEHIQDISVSFYNLYKNIRIQLFEELKASNPGFANDMLVEKAQKFLDRIIFICFCEDLGLLPNDLLHHAIQRGKDSFSDNEYVIWQEIRGVFRAIDGGSTKHSIPAYNGGLFAFDEMLDNLSIKNNFFETIYEISAYDFGTDLDVNILGHIFEQSISDIEELKADVQNEDYDPQKSRRKKDGIYYTPSYITKYIVENSLGKYLEDIRSSLGEEDLPNVEAATTAQLEGRYKKKLLQFYQDYEEKLRKVKVLDPACGSGAFLNQAFDFLLEEYRWTHNKIAELGEGQISIFDSDSYQRSVLQNNLYGVDLNEESVEITKLSLWLKTADSRNALPYLDNNIKCGNSLIDDPEVAGDKAFDWHEEFPEIMAGGGFDVVIGNPPYGVNFGDSEKRYLEKYDKLVPDYEVYVYFISKGIELLKNAGYLSYIFPNTFLANVFGLQYRKRILDDYHIYNIVNLTSDDTFKDAKVRTCIFTIRKSKFTSGSEVITYSAIKPYDKTIYIDKSYTKKEMEANISNWMALSYYSKNDVAIINKIRNCPNLLKDIFEISQGLIPYDKYRGHSEEIIKNRVYHANHQKDETYRKELQGGDVRRYFVKWNGHNWISYGNWLAAPRKQEFFTEPRVLIREIASDRLHCAYTEDEYYNTPSIINIINKDSVHSLKHLLAIVNSKLLTWYYLKTSPKAKKGLFPKIIVKDVSEIPIPFYTKDQSNKLIQHTELMIQHLRTKLGLVNIGFGDILKKYSSQNGVVIQSIVDKSSFKNMVYTKQAKRLHGLLAGSNDVVITVFSMSKKERVELIKFEVKDKHQRDYIIAYLENLTEEQLAEINQYSGNSLDKVLQIKIPDYDKLEVVSKVVSEWNQLQAEIADLERNIEETDKEIDQMVYELYGLTEDEIKIVEQEA